MTDLRKAAEMLMKALDDGWVERGDSVVIALRQALAQPEIPMSPEHLPQYIATNNIKPITEGGGGGGGGTQPEQEPVAWVDTVWVERPDLAKEIQMNRLFSRCQLQDNQIPLYTAPNKPWVGLTNEELVELRETHEAHIFQLMFAIEAKLKEKNT